MATQLISIEVCIWLKSTFTQGQNPPFWLFRIRLLLQKLLKQEICTITDALTVWKYLELMVYLLATWPSLATSEYFFISTLPGCQGGSLASDESLWPCNQ